MVGLDLEDEATVDGSLALWERFESINPVGLEIGEFLGNGFVPEVLEFRLHGFLVILGSRNRVSRDVS